MKKVAIIGGTGYGSVELIRLLQNHPKLEVTKVYSHSQSGEKLSKFYPHLMNNEDILMEELDIARLKDEIDIVFLATPAGVAKTIVPDLLDADIQCVDLSGDLRLNSTEEYEEWYGQEAAPQHIINSAVYGLSEIYKESIQSAKIISNPGCFATAALLGLMPALKSGIIESKGIVIDGKTGVSGAGGTPTAFTHFSETNDNVSPYRIGKHQHTPEVEQYLSQEIDEKVTLLFSSHLVPMTRGLICTMYGNLKQDISTAEVIDAYKSQYDGHSFIRILPEGDFPVTKAVQGSNYCDIGLYVDKRTNQLVIASALDNLVKGAAGQAIQNANIMNGWVEDLGLVSVPIYP